MEEFFFSQTAPERPLFLASNTATKLTIVLCSCLTSLEQISITLYTWSSLARLSFSSPLAKAFAPKNAFLSRVCWKSRFETLFSSSFQLNRTKHLFFHSRTACSVRCWSWLRPYFSLFLSLASVWIRDLAAEECIVCVLLTRWLRLLATGSHIHKEPFYNPLLARCKAAVVCALLPMLLLHLVRRRPGSQPGRRQAGGTLLLYLRLSRWLFLSLLRSQQRPELKFA